MAKKISSEEKKSMLINILSPQYSFYDSNELEKIAIKQAYINSMKVKDVINELVSDDILCNEKIGIKNIYYIPYKSYNIEQAQIDLEDINNNILSLENNINNNIQHRQNSLTYNNTIETLEQKIKNIQHKILQYKNIKHRRNITQNTNIIKHNINKIVDNIYNIIYYVNRNYHIDRTELSKNFNIEDIDYV
ncbi:Mnd1 family protein [Spraguea lophii 42_110]|uniref:Mnd1 family protein n=1 Tax=Spraguea lophii (strain 42_110) TaxID=1358809 RepID=S7WBM9_SPRLO|nr:Mnd1 family protein [Spraguea lophii 42_110]